MSTVTVTAAVSLLLGQSPAYAQVIGKDVANIRWENRGSLDCTTSSFICRLEITQMIDTFMLGCHSETFTLLGSGVGLHHEETPCSARLTAVFNKSAKNPNKPCSLTGNNFSVNFNSGVTSAFNGSFNVGSVGQAPTLRFTPTEFAGFDQNTITEAVIEVDGGNLLQTGGPGEGTIDATLEAHFSPGLFWDCKDDADFVSSALDREGVPQDPTQLITIVKHAP